jgi:hypothetical protein
MVKDLLEEAAEFALDGIVAADQYQPEFEIRDQVVASIHVLHKALVRLDRGDVAWNHLLDEIGYVGCSNLVRDEVDDG